MKLSMSKMFERRKPQRKLGLFYNLSLTKKSIEQIKIRKL